MKSLHLFALVSAGLLASCSKDDNKVNNPPNQNEEELITSLLVELTPAGGAPSVFAFRDPDGPGGSDPVQWDTLKLQPGVATVARLSFLDESDDTLDDITLEILDEADEHQVFFTAQGIGVNVLVNDADINGNPLGLESTWTAPNAGTGTLTISLKHQPGTKAPSPGDISLGETDVEVAFPIRVE